jgi:taurine dioxygenase
MQVERLSGSLGAVISGVDLREPLDDDTFGAVQSALWDHQVVFFPDQELDDDQQRAFATRFGPLDVYPVAKLMGLDTDMTVIEDNPDSPPDADGWHTDISWVETPPSIAVLNALVIPEHGGDTMWASLFGAYDALSPRMKEFCSTLHVRHHSGDEFHASLARVAGQEIADRVAEAYPPVEHPLVRAHPVTGRPALWISGLFMQEVVELSEAESAALLGYLQTLVDDPNHQVRWHWRVGDLAVWDEASTNHRALSDHFPQHRAMRRCTVVGDKPLPVA